MLVENFWLTLQCDLSKDAPDGPGWYIYAARSDGVALLPLRRVTKEQAGRVSDAIERIFDEDAQPPPVLPRQLHESGNQLIRQAIDAQLEEAETIAKRVAKLRKLRAEIAVFEREEKESNSS